MDKWFRKAGYSGCLESTRMLLFNRQMQWHRLVGQWAFNINFVGKGNMSNSHQLIQSIKQRRESFNSKRRYELHDRVKQLRAEIVKNSFQEQPDMKLHQCLMTQLSKARRQLSFSDQIRKELAWNSHKEQKQQPEVIWLLFFLCVLWQSLTVCLQKIEGLVLEWNCVGGLMCCLQRLCRVCRRASGAPEQWVNSQTW